MTDSSSSSDESSSTHHHHIDEVRSPTTTTVSLSPSRQRRTTLTLSSPTSPPRPSILYESSYDTESSSSTNLSLLSPFSIFTEEDTLEDSLLIESSFSASSCSTLSPSNNKQVAFSQSETEVRYFSRSHSELQVMRQFSAEERERRRIRKRQLRTSTTNIFHQLFTDIVSLVLSEDDDESDEDDTSTFSSVSFASSSPTRQAPNDEVQPWFPFQCGVPVQCNAPEL